jgi:hypothetical protein
MLFSPPGADQPASFELLLRLPCSLTHEQHKHRTDTQTCNLADLVGGAGRTMESDFKATCQAASAKCSAKCMTPHNGKKRTLW